MRHLPDVLAAGDWVLVEHPWNWSDKYNWDDNQDLKLMKKLMKTRAPNLTINVPNAIMEPAHLWLCVVAGIITQGLVFFFNAYVAYHKRWLRAGARVASYGFPLWASGTLALIAGLVMCGYVIEQVTTEFIATPGFRATNSCIVRFQKPVSSMNLPGYAFLQRDTRVVVSQRTFLPRQSRATELPETERDFTTLGENSLLPVVTLLGAGIAVAGFVLQNLGTRELHFSASIAQLIATVGLTVMRSFVRRNVGLPAPNCMALRRGGEATHMLHQMCGIERMTTTAKFSVSRDPIAGAQLEVASATSAFHDAAIHRQFALKILNGQLYLAGFHSEQNKSIIDLTEKACDWIKAHHLLAEIEQWILYSRTKKHSPAVSDKADLEPLQGCSLCPIDLNRRGPSILAALWSFCIHEFYGLVARKVYGRIGPREVRPREISGYAMHVIGICKAVDQEERVKLLRAYSVVELGSSSEIKAWARQRDGSLMWERGDSYDSLPGYQYKNNLFGLHHLPLTTE